MLELRQMRIAVLMGGPGSERAVSLASGAGVARALRSLGAEVTEVDVRDANFAMPEGVDLAFNVIHGTFGEDGQVQRILEKRGVRYTGEGIVGSELAINKIATKQRLRERGIPTAGFEILETLCRPSLKLPYVLKAPNEGSSVGVYVVKEEADVEVRLEDIKKFGYPILVESFIEGRELTVGVLGDRALPLVEIVPKQGFYDFQNKYPFLNPKAAGADHFCPAVLDAEVTARIQEVGLAAHRALDLEVYSRVDVILDAQNQPWVLEINTIPGMTESSLLPEAAAAVGISYAELCARVVALSLRKYS
jgi:D-alanine-D-alanine ligase